jgi:hypothetical protein
VCIDFQVNIYNLTNLDTLASIRALLPFFLLLASSSQSSRPGTYNHTPKTATYNAAKSQYTSTIWASAFIEQNPVTQHNRHFYRAPDNLATRRRHHRQHDNNILLWWSLDRYQWRDKHLRLMAG